MNPLINHDLFIYLFLKDRAVIDAVLTFSYVYWLDSCAEIRTGSVRSSLSGWQMDVDCRARSFSNPLAPFGWLLWRFPAYISAREGSWRVSCPLRCVKPPHFLLQIKKTKNSIYSLLFPSSSISTAPAGCGGARRCRSPCGNEGVINSRLD